MENLRRRQLAISVGALALALGGAWLGSATLLSADPPRVLLLAYAPEAINLSLGPPLTGMVSVNVTVSSSNPDYFGTHVCWRAEAIGLLSVGNATILPDAHGSLREVPQLYSGIASFQTDITTARSPVRLESSACTPEGTLFLELRSVHVTIPIPN